MAYKVLNDNLIADDQTVNFDRIFAQVVVQGLVSQAQGLTFGYAAGGVNPTPAAVNVIDRFPFSADIINATDVGDLTVARSSSAASSSQISGYASGAIPSPAEARIEKWPFASATTNATTVGTQSVLRGASQAGHTSTTHGYSSGGATAPGVPGLSNIIDRFPFSSDTNATDVGDLTVARSLTSGQSSTTHGYTSGGTTGGAAPPGVYYNTIDRFPFAVATTNATDVGDLSAVRGYLASSSSYTHGYVLGGAQPGTVNVIERFPFSVATTNTTDVGDLSAVRYWNTGNSSFSNGFSMGGTQSTGPFTALNIIERFPFSATTTNTTDVGDLTVARFSIGSSGQTV